MTETELDKLHTTPMGEERIRRNLRLTPGINPLEFCLNIITDPAADIIRKGKNFYVTLRNYRITINCMTYTIITAHITK